MNDYHIPVLLDEAVSSLQVTEGKKYIDATLGGGGHTEEILRRGGCVLAFDVDLDAINHAEKRLAAFLKTACPCPQALPNNSLRISKQNPGASPLINRLTLVRSNFSRLKEAALENNFVNVDGILFDLGVSSHQLETPDRGFSFNADALLDMRMDRDLAVKAGDLINGLNEGELYELFTKLGEEHHSRAIAHALISARKIKPIEKTDELAKIILRVSRRSKADRTHPATRIFQALRIAVNDELNSLKSALPQALEILKPGGRLVFISFHSLEDRIVKNYFREMETARKVNIISKHPLTPSPSEISRNPRSRSAKLRIAERLDYENL